MVTRIGVALVSAFSCLVPCLAGVPPYTLVGTVELPVGSASYDTLPDGRLLSIVGTDLYRQDSVNGSAWTRIGSLPDGSISSFGASFVRVSPDGSMIAVGDNNFGPGATVYTFALASLDPGAPTTPEAWPASNLDAHWADPNTLYVAGASAGGEVREIKIGSATSRIVLNNIGLSAGGVYTDGVRLYAGNGFDLVPGGSETGDVRAFELASITSAVTPIDFESSGITVARALSGASLGFDPLGNLLIGGGDLFGGSNDYGYAAIVDSDAVAAALMGGPVAPDSSELRVAPSLETHSYFPRFNAGANELLISFFDNSTFASGTTLFRYAVPAPAPVVIVAFVLARGRGSRAASMKTGGRGGTT
ncbi:MAG: hypothetical protein JNK58_02075 [Phycisphaerae bacterium]|nr:hypothetical protein [Phycisphaerae bacterium]